MESVPPSHIHKTNMVDVFKPYGYISVYYNYWETILIIKRSPNCYPRCIHIFISSSFPCSAQELMVFEFSHCVATGYLRKKRPAPLEASVFSRLHLIITLHHRTSSAHPDSIAHQHIGIAQAGGCCVCEHCP